MTTKRVKCGECENMVLPATAEANGGLCAQCIKISPVQRQAIRAFEQALEGGLLWVPSPEELESARTPACLVEGRWGLEPNYYKDERELTVTAVVERAATSLVGNVFLVCDTGERLNLTLNPNYGVCEYQNEGDEDWRYAYSPLNQNSQVANESHLSQSCACCGVGVGWYPSRAHMPSNDAISIVRDTVYGRPNSIQWLKLDDISRYFRGRG